MRFHNIRVKVLIELAALIIIIKEFDWIWKILFNLIHTWHVSLVYSNYHSNNANGLYIFVTTGHQQ